MTAQPAHDLFALPAPAPALRVVELPGVSWTEDTTLTTSKGVRLQRWDSVAKACKILDGCDRHALYDLIAAGLIKGYKLKPWAPNSKYKVDLVSVWQFKHGQGSR